MKILYFGTVCDPTRYEHILKGCKRKPTVATVVFESALLEGFKQNGVKLEIHSFPMIPTFPNSKLLRFGGQEETLRCGYRCRWLKTVNFPFVKQLSRRMDGRKVLKRWCRENAGDGVLLTYSLPPFLTKEMLRYAKRYGIKTVAIVPDLPANMYLNHKSNRVLYALKSLYLRSSLKYQDKFDGYVYLTKAMSEAMAPGKPYIVVEGILNTDSHEVSEKCSKAAPRAIMYAGQLHEKYGITHLLDAFERLQLEDTQLWLFGAGNSVPEIQKRAAENPKICYFGRVSREEILKRESQATLLINPRSVKDAFTKYSFPSKIIEYMYSGTPLLTTRLEGIPSEYFDYVFSAPDNTAPYFDAAMQEALLLSDDLLKEKGWKARQFVVKEKNAKKQSEKILRFIGTL